VEASALAVDFNPTPGDNNPVNFVDHRAFDTSFGPEMETLAQIETMIERGEEFVQVWSFWNQEKSSTDHFASPISYCNALV
jgi:hypothetical protein